jgi:hypothetical protein
MDNFDTIQSIGENIFIIADWKHKYNTAGYVASQARQWRSVLPQDLTGL